jgi:hypothetical protein
MPKRPRIKDRMIQTSNEIVLFFHCKRCLAAMPVGQSPSSWSRLSTGFTPLGIQVWCDRHDVNIMHVDFEGLQHPAREDGEPGKPDGDNLSPAMSGLFGSVN